MGVSVALGTGAGVGVTVAAGVGVGVFVRGVRSGKNGKFVGPGGKSPKPGGMRGRALAAGTTKMNGRFGLVAWSANTQRASGVHALTPRTSGTSHAVPAGLP